jgi:hypothetical protein
MAESVTARNRPGNIDIKRASRARAEASEQQQAKTNNDQASDAANDLADAAFKATLGFTEEQRRANVARFKTMLMRRDAHFGTTG